jgi:hypothetical protein
MFATSLLFGPSEKRSLINQHASAYFSHHSVKAVFIGVKNQVP